MTKQIYISIDISNGILFVNYCIYSALNTVCDTYIYILSCIKYMFYFAQCDTVLYFMFIRLVK